MKSWSILCASLYVCANLASLEAVSQGKGDREIVTLTAALEQTFSTQYAPVEWKETFLGWNLGSQLEILQGKLGNVKQDPVAVRKALNEFFGSMNDYHVGAVFYSNVSSTLPLTITAAEGRYFITSIDRAEISKSRFSANMGDEIVSWNGHPVKEEMEVVKEQLYVNNSEASAEALATIFLTKRSGQVGLECPQGKVSLGIRSKKNGKMSTHVLSWNSEAETIPTKGMAAKGLKNFPKKAKSSLFNKSFSIPYVRSNFFRKKGSHTIGSKEGFLPSLGEKLWEGEGEFFEAYTFKDPKGRIIGFLRIPTYMVDDIDNIQKVVEEFRSIINRFEKKTQLLVIDQMHNPGGMLDLCYSLMACLTDKPLKLPLEQDKITQEDVSTAVMLRDLIGLLLDGDESILEDIQEYLPENFIESELLEKIDRYASHIIDQWVEGKTLTDPYPLAGLDALNPDKEAQYSKPILFLIDSTSFSCADLVPAVLQDNERAVIMGEKTAGAGGAVSPGYYMPNTLGLAYYQITRSIVLRSNGEVLENLGVTPNVPYQFKAEDLQNRYAGFKRAIFEQIDEMLD